MRQPGLNPMIFKEVTQGTRSNGFLTFFLMLLGVSWLSLFLIVAYQPDQAYRGGWDGHDLAMILLFFAYVFGLVVGSRSFQITVSEVENRTIELYLLAGMSPERFVMGKLLTCATMFGFGLSVILPFILSAYFLSGLDPVVLAAMIYLTLMFLGAFFAASVTLALVRSMLHAKSIVTIGYFIGICSAFFMGISFIAASDRQSMLAFTMGIRWMFSGIFGISGGADPWLAFLLVHGIYLLVLGILFVWSCHLICPESDGREAPLKALCTLVLGAIVIWAFYTSDQTGLRVLGGAYTFGILAMGLLFWGGVTPVGLMPALRVKQARGPLRVYYFLFEPGLRGTLRLLLILTGLGIASSHLLDNTATYGDSSLDKLRFYWALGGLYLWHVYYWRLLLASIPGLKGKPVNLMAVMGLAWCFLVVAVWVVHSQVYPNSYNWAFGGFGTTVVALFTTPLMSLTALAELNDFAFARLLCYMATLVAIVGMATEYRRATPAAHVVTEEDMAEAPQPSQIAAGHVAAIPMQGESSPPVEVALTPPEGEPSGA